VLRPAELLPRRGAGLLVGCLAGLPGHVYCVTNGLKGSPGFNWPPDVDQERFAQRRTLGGGDTLTASAGRSEGSGVVARGFVPSWQLISSLFRGPDTLRPSSRLTPV